MTSKQLSVSIHTIHRQLGALTFICILSSTCFVFSAGHCNEVHKTYEGSPFRNSTTSASYNKLGLEDMRRGDTACALQFFLAAVGKDSSSWDANFNLGR